MLPAQDITFVSRTCIV